MCLGAIASNVNQVADLKGHGSTGTAAMGFGSLISETVIKLQGVLLSNNLEVRKRDLGVSELVALKPHLAGRQSSVTDTGFEIGSH